MFNFQNKNWKSILINKIKNIYDKRICKFNYKLLNNISCNSFLDQCKLRPNKCCNYCQDTTENVEYLIFKCDNVKEIWSTLCTIMQLDMMWKHVIIDFYYENNLRVHFLNNIIFYVACMIYKFKVLCRFEEKNEISQSLNI